MSSTHLFAVPGVGLRPLMLLTSPSSAFAVVYLLSENRIVALDSVPVGLILKQEPFHHLKYCRSQTGLRTPKTKAWTLEILGE